MNSEELLARKGGLFNLRLNLADAFDAEDPNQKESVEMMTQDSGDSHYIVLRELTGAEMVSIQATPENEIMTALEKMLPEVLIDTSFRDSKGNKPPNGDIVKILKMSANLLIYVLTEWQQASPLQKRTLKASTEPRVS